MTMHSVLAAARRSVITGVVTIIPLWITWLVVKFLVEGLMAIGAPFVIEVSALLAPLVPSLSSRLLHPFTQGALALVLVITFLAGLGWITNRVIGAKLIDMVDRIMARIPMVQMIYGAVKKLLATLQTKPDSAQRVVLIDFPSAGMKAIGLVTRTMTDETTGRELAAVFVPTTPNPTSGYLEIVPIESLTPISWTVDEAMTFIISVGAVSPSTVRYTKPVAREAIPSPANDPLDPTRAGR